MTTVLVFIRHGITGWNRKRRYCGFRDILLSAEGKAQAARLRRRLKAVKFYRVYSSDMRRAVQTARIAFGKVKITREPGLKELNFGALEGMTHKEAREKYPGLYDKWLADPFRNRMPGQEKMSVFKRRVIAAVRRIERDNAGKTVAVVCHGGSISMSINTIMKKKDFWHYVPDAASISTVAFKNGTPRLRRFNDTGHLKGVGNG